MIITIITILDHNNDNDFTIYLKIKICSFDDFSTYWLTDKLATILFNLSMYATVSLLYVSKSKVTLDIVEDDWGLF